MDLRFVVICGLHRVLRAQGFDLGVLHISGGFFHWHSVASWRAAVCPVATGTSASAAFLI